MRIAKAVWPFGRRTLEEEKEREWSRYRSHLAHTLHRQGYRGERVSFEDAWEWACRYVSEAKRQQAAWASEDAE